MRQTVHPLAAESRAVEEGLTARLRPDGTFAVRSSSRHGLVWTVAVGMVKTKNRWLLKFSCDCESGTARPSEFVSCLHAAAVGRSLERRGLARWISGLWEPTEKMRGMVA